MNLVKKTLFLLATSALLFSACTKNDDDDDNQVVLGDKNGILLVTFGSSYEAPQETFKTIDAVAKAKFPGVEVRWGYTSDLILNKLRQGNGEGALKGIIIDNDTPEEALNQMIKEGYSKITIQSLHIIPGEEFDEILATVDAIKKTYPGLEIAVGKPLLDSDEDLEEVAEFLVEKFKAQKDAGEPVLFMGHGTPHHINHQKYIELQTVLSTLAPQFFVGTVEKAPMIDEVLSELEALNLTRKKVTITPLMSIAGDHANNDMNGVTDAADLAEQSWKERLQNKGYTVESIMAGLGDYPEINAIWMKHLEAVYIQ